MKPGIKVYAAVVISMIFWAFSFVWFKVANQHYSPITIVFLRLVISGTILTIFLLATGRLVKIPRVDRNKFLLLSLFEPFFYFLGESYGLTYVSSTVGSVMISTIPVFAALGAWIIYRERLTILNYAGIALSFAGVMLFVFNSDGSLSVQPVGIALMFIAVMSAVGYTLVLKNLAGTYNPVYIVNIQNIIGTILFLPIFIFTDGSEFLKMEHTIGNLMPVIKLAIFASSGAFILFAYAVRHLGITKSNVFSNFIPVFTAIFAWMILGDSISTQSLIGMGIVIAGLFLSQRNGRKKRIIGEILPGKTA